MPWRIPETDIERVKRETDLLALVQSRGIELKNHGGKDFDWPLSVPPGRRASQLHCDAGQGAVALHGVRQGGQRHPVRAESTTAFSFRHAFELLRQGGTAVFAAQPLTTAQATVPRLPCPLDAEADDAALFGQVAAYYHQRLKATAATRGLIWRGRGLDSDELIDHFQIGFADRTLGLRLPDKNRQEGERLRSRLTQLGLWRESGHEHFNGCIVVPFQTRPGRSSAFTDGGRSGATLKHLYLPGPHRGLVQSPTAFEAQEIILCEAVFDALTFWAAGFRNVTCLFGTEGFTDELWEAVKKARRVRIAYDADDAGDRAAQRDAERFKAHGIEVWRVKFPHGMDANEYACKVKPADKSLALLLNAAQWLGAGTPPPAARKRPSARRRPRPSRPRPLFL